MALKIQSTIKPDGGFHIAEAEDILMPDGKRLSEFKGGGADAFISSTAEISPSEIAEMVKEGRPVYITYTDSTYGVVGFSDFSFLESMSLLVASTYLNMGFGVFSVTLLGSVSKNEWGFMLEPLARQDDLPKTVNEVDITGFDESGVITEKYLEGGENTYNFNYDEATDSTTITDSNGGETVIKGFNPNGSSSVPENGEDGFSPVIEINKIEGGHRVSVTDKNGTQTFDVMDGMNGEDGKDGADGADGEGGDFVEPLAGDSSEITPAEVAEAIEAGRPVYITHTDDTYGVLAFTNFARAVSLNTVFASFVIEYGGKTLGAFLGGTPGYSQWQFDVMELAKAGEGGEANPLVGSTAEITPEQVAAAVEAGRTVYITHTDATYGTVGFSDFAKMQQGIMGNLVFVQEDFVISAGLLGNLNDGTWTFNVSSLLTDSGEVLPEVSTDDNGKFLQVENGVWVAAVVPSAEGASF